jgi:hypothetical protein
MITVEIINSNESLAIDISKYVLEKKYALETHIDTNKKICISSELKTIRLFFLTKALLFDTISNDLKEKYKSDSLIIYATPVSHVDKEFGELLRLNLKAV